MAVPSNKSELIAAIEVGYDKLIAELADIPSGMLREQSLEGHAKGTSMSVDDLLAYLLGWGKLVLKWHKRMALGQEIDWPETGYGWNELGPLARKFYADHAHASHTDLLEQLAQNKQAIVSLIQSKSDSELYGTPWYGKWTMGRMIGFNTASPYVNARGRLRKWKKANGL